MKMKKILDGGFATARRTILMNEYSASTGCLSSLATVKNIVIHQVLFMLKRTIYWCGIIVDTDFTWFD